MPMPEMFAKVDLLPIVRDHYRTLRTQGGSARGDLILFVGLPIAASGLAVRVGDVRLGEVGNLLTAFAVLAGFLFALLIVVLESAIGMAARAEDQSGATASIRRRAAFMVEVKANVAYATLIAIVLTSVMAWLTLAVKPEPSSGGGGLATQPTSYGAGWTFVVIALAIHFMLTLLMIVKRIYRIIGGELRTASTADGPASHV